ncbi:MAG: hypothetical protein ACRCT6_13110, partial [Notoacmeibacter sp.]
VNGHTGKRRILEAFPAAIIKRMQDDDMFIELKNGATFQLIGSDRYDSTVGSGPKAVAYSEWALSNPAAWAYHQPMIREAKGLAAFITTPRGNNHAKTMYDRAKENPNWFAQLLTADDTGALSEQDLEEALKEYQDLWGIDFGLSLFNQEYLCSFAGAMIGSYFGAEMFRAERDGRVCDVAIDEKHPVHTAWDLGAAHNNPIWCFQVIGAELRVVDFYLPESQDIQDWCAWLNAKGYNGNDYVPHDILVTEWGSGKTRIDTLRQLGRKPRRIPRVSVADGLQAGRVAINSMVIDANRCEHGIEGLKAYRRDWDDERKTFRDVPVKDWAEHIGSAWRYLGLSWREEVQAKPVEVKKELVYVAKPDGTVVGNISVRDAVEAMVRRRRGRGRG